MFRRQRQRPFQRVVPGRLCLAGSPKMKSRLMLSKPALRAVAKACPTSSTVDPAQKVQFRWLKALHAHAQAVDAQRPQHRKLGLIDRAGIGFTGDLGAGVHGKVAMHGAKELLQLRRRQHGRRAAAHKDGAHRAAGQPLAPARHLDAERIHQLRRAAIPDRHRC